MKTITIVTKKEIKINKGTVIPMLTANDEPIGYDILIPIGAKLEERRGCTITTYGGLGYCYTTPYIWAIFKFICDKAIEDGSEKIVAEDNKKVFKMFSLITENRIKAEEGNYITDFEAEKIEDAEILAKEFVAKSNLGNDFQYTIRQ